MYRIKEFSEVMADACLRDSEGRFLFLSIYGRDTAILQFMSAMELPANQRGVDLFHLVDAQGKQSTVQVGGTDRLTKVSMKLPRATVFGAMTHTWIYHAALQQPDMVSRLAWVVVVGDDHETTADQLADKTWEMVKQLSPVPLVSEWRACVMEEVQRLGLVSPVDHRLFPPLGPVRAMRVSLGQEFDRRLSELVAAGRLTLPNRLPA